MPIRIAAGALAILAFVTLLSAPRAEFVLKTVIPGVADTDSRQSIGIQKAIAVTFDERFAYVIDTANPRLAVVEIARGKVLKHLPMPGYPMSIILDKDGKNCYVTTADLIKETTSLLKVNVDTTEVTVLADSVGQGFLYDLCLSNDGNIIYMTCHWGQSLVSFDTRDGRMEELLRFDTYRDGRPWGIVVGSRNERAFVSVGTHIFIIALKDLRIINRIPVADNFIRMSPDGKRLYVAGESITEIDISSPVVTEVKRTLPLGHGYGCTGLDISPDGRLLFATYVRDSSKGRLFRGLMVLDLDTFSIVQTLSFADTVSGVTASSNGDRLYVRMWPRDLGILERE